MPTFLDEARIYVAAGDGGNGAMHFRREKFVPLGGPDGGDGGNGGDIFLRADRGLNTLFAFQRRRRFQAEAGTPGGPSRMRGGSGKDLVVDVPVGTVVQDGETGERLADLTGDGETYRVARGGKGGLGNVHFKTSTHQAPRFAEKGEPGQQRWLELELKVIADMGIIGCPNAGKSTLLSVISAARPKIADYPFTTLSPNLGVVEAGDYTFVAADIPGLIEGAHEGVGLGHEFLRHIERTVVLVHVLDGGAPDPLESFRQVNQELVQYDQTLAGRSQIVVCNKMDLLTAQENWKVLKSALEAQGHEAHAISAATRAGIDTLVYRVAEIVRNQLEMRLKAEADDVEIITIAPPADHFEVERTRRTFHVRGETVERLAVMTDLESDEAVYRLQRRLKQMGVVTALQKAGAREGSKIKIGETEFQWDSTFEPEVKPERHSAAPRRKL